MANMKTLLLLFLISSCSFFLGGKEAPKTAKGSLYSISFGQPGWIYKQDKRSDFIFENEKDGRILLSNSFCEEFQEDSLDRLALKTFDSVKDFKPSISEYTTFKNREAYQVEGNGLVDGVKVHLRILNTRRNNCYFDFLSIIPKTTIEIDSAFKNFLDSVVFK
jgi:hypothetical protein